MHILVFQLMMMDAYTGLPIDEYPSVYILKTSGVKDLNPPNSVT